MEVYILDSLLRREQVVDRFESLIWTERFSEYGDFQLVVTSDGQSRRQFVTGVRLAINGSHRVMTVETVVNGTDDEGRNILKVSGRSLEAILEDRVARNSVSDTKTNPVWTIKARPGNVAREMFDAICRRGILDLNDVIPFLQATGTIFPADNIPEPQYEITHAQKPATLYNAIRELCVMYDLGFRLVRNFDTSQLYFNVYTGSDRTSAQKTLPAVVFSPEMDNLQNTTALKTTEDAKNVAHVVSDVGAVIVYGDNVDPEVEGFERRVLLVETTVETNEGSTDPLKPPLTAEQIQAALVQAGREELSKHRTLSAFDGEIDQRSTYRYGVDYNLGDMVEIRNADNESNYMRVTEQIFVSDQEGERSYPTLTLNQYINPGSWLAWNYNQSWIDLDTSLMSWSQA